MDSAEYIRAMLKPGRFAIPETCTSTRRSAVPVFPSPCRLLSLRPIRSRAGISEEPMSSRSISRNRWAGTQWPVFASESRSVVQTPSARTLRVPVDFQDQSCIDISLISPILKSCSSKRSGVRLDNFDADGPPWSYLGFSLTFTSVYDPRPEPPVVKRVEVARKPTPQTVSSRRLFQGYTIIVGSLFHPRTCDLENQIVSSSKKPLSLIETLGRDRRWDRRNPCASGIGGFDCSITTSLVGCRSRVPPYKIRWPVVKEEPSRLPHHPFLRLPVGRQAVPLPLDVRHSANQRRDGWTRPPTAQTAGRRRFRCRIFRANGVRQALGRSFIRTYLSGSPRNKSHSQSVSTPLQYRFGEKFSNHCLACRGKYLARNRVPRILRIVLGSSRARFCAKASKAQDGIHSLGRSDNTGQFYRETSSIKLSNLRLSIRLTEAFNFPEKNRIRGTSYARFTIPLEYHFFARYSIDRIGLHSVVESGPIVESGKTHVGKVDSPEGHTRHIIRVGNIFQLEGPNNVVCNSVCVLALGQTVRIQALPDYPGPRPPFDATKSTKGASKLRRDLINAEIANLRDLLPLPPSTRQRLSQLQLMALVCVYTISDAQTNRRCRRPEINLAPVDHRMKDPKNGDDPRMNIVCYLRTTCFFKICHNFKSICKRFARQIDIDHIGPSSNRESCTRSPNVFRVRCWEFENSENQRQATYGRPPTACSMASICWPRVNLASRDFRRDGRLETPAETLICVGKGPPGYSCSRPSGGDVPLSPHPHYLGSNDSEERLSESAHLGPLGGRFAR
ncbi:unnamed protein product [Nesidiocoris tenuis]|uniref:BHLH domain-containing protein n=1 Tax=Nesidiocoris tenuis TaxID=355587 RepID=A0A6H5HEV7_9HEMI|nr:unnamed protein product [Nesidiocoris tenuis]